MLTKLRQESPSTFRLLGCAIAGVGTAAVLLVMHLRWPIIVLGAWAISAATFLITTWAELNGLSPADTAQRATREDDTRTEAGVIVVVSSVASLIGVGFGLITAADLDGTPELLMTALCVASVALSWGVVHTVFTLRYAHEYYSHAGGFDFNGDEPAYLEFSYVAFTIGMTFQVSDTSITSTVIRRTVLRHALLAYLFGTFIVALMINVVAGLVG